MYCSNCGKPLNANLHYCNSCGTRVESKPQIARSGSPMLGIGSIFIGCIGLMAFYPIMRELLRSPLDTAAVILILVAYLLTVFSMFTVLIWQGRHPGGLRSGANQPSENFGGQEAFRAINTAQLMSPIQPVASVTEHTTRTLEPTPAKRS